MSSKQAYFRKNNFEKYYKNVKNISLHPSFGTGPFRFGAMLYLRRKWPQIANKYQSTSLATVGHVLIVVEFQHHIDNNHIQSKKYQKNRKQHKKCAGTNVFP